MHPAGAGFWPRDDCNISVETPYATQQRSGDGRLTLADFEAAGAEQFRAVDTDGNGTVSSEELNGVRQRQAEQTRRNAEAAREAQERAACAMPKASDAAKVVVLSGYRSEAISRVGLGSQDIMTGTGEIKIELTRNSRGEFIIHRQIRFPAGLSGHSVKFVLLRGVPVPEGNSDGATVISEETGFQLKLERR